VAKNVFRADEILYQSRKIFIEPPRVEPPPEEPEVQEAGAEYSGPTVDDLRREADTFKAHWEEEKARLLSGAQEEAEKIKKEAERVAFDEVKRKNNQAQKIRQEAEDEAKRPAGGGPQEGRRAGAEIRTRVEKTEKEASDRGQEAGREQGYQEGRAEVQRLVDNLQRIITSPSSGAT